jgi:hypothetical protein
MIDNKFGKTHLTPGTIFLIVLTIGVTYKASGAGKNVQS